MLRFIITGLAVGFLLGLPAAAIAEGKDDVPGLVKQLKLLKDIKARVKVIEDLGKIGPDAKEASQVLVEAMVERPAAIRQAAAEALEKINPELQKPVLTLLVDAQKKFAALDELAGMEAEAKPAVPMLLAMFRAELANPGRSGLTVGGDVSLASKLLIAMTKIAPEDKGVLQTVLDTVTAKSAGGVGKVSTQSNSEVRFTAIDVALDLKLDPKLLTKALVTALNDLYCRFKAIDALGELGPMAKDAVPTLKKLKLDMDETVRDAAARALERIEEGK